MDRWVIVLFTKDQNRFTKTHQKHIYLSTFVVSWEFWVRNYPSSIPPFQIVVFKIERKREGKEKANPFISSPGALLRKLVT